ADTGRRSASRPRTGWRCSTADACGAAPSRRCASRIASCFRYAAEATRRPRVNSNPDCVFCKIVAGQIPSTRVYEDADALAFMDIGQVNPGHVLVAAKAHAENIY